MSLDIKTTIGDTLNHYGRLILTERVQVMASMISICTLGCILIAIFGNVSNSVWFLLASLGFGWWIVCRLFIRFHSVYHMYPKVTEQFLTHLEKWSNFDPIVPPNEIIGEFTLNGEQITVNTNLDESEAFFSAVRLYGKASQGQMYIATWFYNWENGLLFKVIWHARYDWGKVVVNEAKFVPILDASMLGSWKRMNLSDQIIGAYKSRIIDAFKGVIGEKPILTRDGFTNSIDSFR